MQDEGRESTRYLTARPESDTQYRNGKFGYHNISLVLNPIK